jgi:enoyl-[acyl-carrier protein] reductase II
MNLKTPICDQFEIEYPIFLAGMGGVSYAAVCAAVSEAGGYGTLGMAQQTPEQIRAEMREVKSRTSKPFGVDLLAALPDHMMECIDVIIEEGATSFIAGLGVPEALIDKCHENGVKVVSMCGKVRHAVRAQEAGCDVVVAQGTEAGGHTGQVGGMALIPQIVDAVDIPVLGAGSIVDGRGLVAALAFGAQGVWMGTRFVASHEAHAAELYKKRIAAIREEDTVVTRCYSGKPMRVIRNAYVQDWERRLEDIQPFPQQLIASLQAGVFDALQPGLAENLDPERAAMPCGQGAGAIHEILPCKAIIERTMREARATIERVAGLRS